MAAAAEKARRAIVDGAQHTDASLAAMKTTEVAALVAAIRGGKPPKPATKAKAIELFWKAAESLPRTPEAPKATEVQDAKAEATDATGAAPGSKEEAPGKAPKVKRYAVTIEGAEQAAAVQAMNPLARRLAEGRETVRKAMAKVRGGHTSGHTTCKTASGE